LLLLLLLRFLAQQLLRHHCHHLPLPAVLAQPLVLLLLLLLHQRMSHQHPQLQQDRQHHPRLCLLHQQLPQRLQLLLLSPDPKHSQPQQHRPLLQQQRQLQL
jgi:hypothetical protein